MIHVKHSKLYTPVRVSEPPLHTPSSNNTHISIYVRAMPWSTGEHPYICRLNGGPWSRGAQQPFGIQVLTDVCSTLLLLSLT